ncbi:ATP-binding protein [Geofilum sp. OHC36d9]
MSVTEKSPIFSSGAALVDRLTHKAHLVNMNGESYRLKETKEMNNK